MVTFEAGELRQMTLVRLTVDPISENYGFMSPTTTETTNPVWMPMRVSR